MKKQKLEITLKPTTAKLDSGLSELINYISKKTALKKQTITDAILWKALKSCKKDSIIIDKIKKTVNDFLEEIDSIVNEK